MMSLIEPCNDIEEGSLSRAGIAGQGVEFALFKRNVGMIVNHTAAVAVRVAVAKLFHVQRYVKAKGLLKKCLPY